MNGCETNVSRKERRGTKGDVVSYLESQLVFECYLTDIELPQVLATHFFGPEDTETRFRVFEARTEHIGSQNMLDAERKMTYQFTSQLLRKTQKKRREGEDHEKERAEETQRLMINV